MQCPRTWETYVEDSDHDLGELRAEEMDKDEELWTLYLALKHKMKIDPKETGYVPFYAFLDFMTKEMIPLIRILVSPSTLLQNHTSTHIHV